MRIIILGASGQIGNQVYKELKKNSAYEVVGTSRKAEKDLLKFDPLKDSWSLLEKADVLINSVGQIEESKEFSFDKVHRQLTMKIVENRELLGNPRIIQVSVLGASKEVAIDFLKTKGIADEYLLQFPNTLVVRPSIVCTHQTVLVKKMLMLLKISKFSAGFVLVPKDFPDHKIQPVLCEDLAIIISKLCESPPDSRIINIVGPDVISYRALIELMYASIGKKARLVEISRKLTDFLVKAVVSPFFPSVINDQQYQMLFKDNVGDRAEAEHYLGRPLNQTFDFWNNEFN